MSGKAGGWSMLGQVVLVLIQLRYEGTRIFVHPACPKRARCDEHGPLSSLLRSSLRLFTLKSAVSRTGTSQAHIVILIQYKCASLPLRGVTRLPCGYDSRTEHASKRAGSI
ncbi:uncharacterized protein SCHCODRAFT_02245770 [Schizophyllum commune H4-8]|uniref:uncharacterized protein n=1 Tax=Schizophyllum commune (strain H4-8 / FGSC 9210) TaxID=578458 RepID=UPI0021603046|nr:uncharacterized protein SCHCODRAFT_02245770 [Schizophyllum commune H4-8]KAI5893125.1 hypothetical protein SCHCODRAFT_02245770 [Schizophyllum commune H4-8]